MAPSTGSGERARRRKISLACEPCRVRKSRCDGGKPICATCERRDLPLSRCIYTVEQNARMASNDEYIAALHERIHRLESAVQAHTTHSQGTPEASTHVSVISTLAHGASVQPGTPMPSRELDPPAAADVSFLPSLRTPSPSGADNSASHHVRHQQPDDEVPRDRDLGPGESQITAMGTVASEDGRDSDATPRDEFYHGNSSAASFIKETCNGVMSLQEVFNPQISDSGRSLMPGPTRPAWRTSASYVLPPRPLADHLVERYFDRVFPLYPFIHRPSFERAYKSLWEPTGMSQPIGPDDPNPPHVGLGGSPNAGANSVVFHCALNVMFALACHFSEWIDENRDETALGFLDRSKSLMTLDFLESETLGVVQALLITALFFQSTTFAGPCWNSIGIACRLAQGAGLHTESGGARWSPIETEMRRRVWHSCVVLDMLVSMTFGRPTMVTHASNVPLPSLTEKVDDADAHTSPGDGLRMRYFLQSIRLSTILEKILVQVYQPWRSKSKGDETNVENHYCSNFDTLDNRGGVPDSSSGPLLMQRNAIQGRFFYVRLMLHRPLLSRLWSSHRLQSSGTPAATSGLASSITGNNLRSTLTIECGSSCVRCAMHLLDLTYSTFRTQHGAAWWWNALYASTAGLVLAMALSCPLLHASLDVSSLQQSWDVCRAILSQIAKSNTSVQKSLELLDKFYSLTCAGSSVDEHSITFASMGGNEATLPDFMAQFYPQDMIADLGVFESDPTLVGST